MVKVHGQKRHYQVLLDPGRAQLLEDLAAERGERSTALARELIYAGLQRLSDSATYALRLAEDEATRRQGIANQVSGRRQRRGHADVQQLN